MNNFNKGITKNKTILFFAIISILPFIRSCGELSFGFPAVAFELEVAKFSIIGLLINVISIFFFSALFLKFYNSRFYKNSYNFGVFFVILYHIWYIIGYFIVYVTKIVNGEIMHILQWSLYPSLISLDRFSGGILNNPIPPLYTDSLDLSIRISYVLSVILYFVIGILFFHIDGMLKPTKKQKPL